MKEVHIERKAPPDPRTSKRAVPEKDNAILDGLPPYSDIEAYIVAVNTFYESNASNTVNFSTPEGGKF